ncbi:hypothetical protein ACF0H5_014912 [Mactra antiquata]
MEYKKGDNSKSEKRKYEDDDSESEMRRLTANSQERVRMQKINNALEDLKKCLPESFHLHHRRMSKIRALRSAMVYIRGLSQLLHEDNMRRQGQYMQAMDYMRCLYESQQVYVPEVGRTCSALQTPETNYPYLGPLCAKTQSVVETPEQTQMSQNYHPRVLDFSMNSNTKHLNSTPEDPSSSIETDNKTTFIEPTNDFLHLNQQQNHQHQPIRLKHPRRYNTHCSTPLRSATTKSESFTSPLMGDRNDNEINLSVLSSDNEYGQSYNVDTGDSLQNIVDDNYNF